MVKILYRGRRKVVFFGRQGRETVFLRRARKSHLCHSKLRDGILIERHFIKPGELYFEDHITYIQKKRGGGAYRKHHTIRVCDRCWKGPKPLDCLPVLVVN